MKKLFSMFTLLALLATIAVPFVAQATEKGKSEVVMVMENKAHLTHRGEGDVKDAVAVNDVLSVYRRLGKNYQLRKVGEIKVLSYVDQHTFEAVITEGKIKEGDIAK